MLYFYFVYYHLNIIYQHFRYPWFPEWFNIIYDSDQAVYTYHKLDNDLEAADLEIIV